VFSAALAPYAPLPRVEKTEGGRYRLVEHAAQTDEAPFGRLCAFHGQMGMWVRALSYMMSHGADGLRQVAEDAVLNANYILARVQDVMTPAFPGTCMHEALIDDRFLKDTGVTTLDFAKAMIDEGYHPMTMYFPLVVHGAMLVEPTETEGKAALDQFIGALRSVAERGKAGDPSLKSAPHFAPRARLDETLAARKPVLTWKAPDLPVAAE
jgi:glycine dehydrogenase subunit 2